jgi:transposase
VRSVPAAGKPRPISFVHTVLRRPVELTLTDLRNRGVRDVFLVVCDGLKGLSEVVGNVWPAAIVQTCIIHLIRNTFRLASKRDWDALRREVKPIYTAVNAAAACEAFEQLAEVWGQRYPAIVRLWDNAWEEFIPFLDYGACRKITRVVRLELVTGSGSWGVAKSYRPVLRDQPMLLPVDMREWLPADHLVWFVVDTVDVLDVSDFEQSRHRGGAGAAGFDPRMLLGLLIYAYCHRVRSSRQVERLCHTDIAFRVLCAQDVPDHATIARFRADHEDAFADLFGQVLMIAGRAGPARFGTAAIDGTKIAANASIDANRGRAWFAEQATTMIADAIDDARADQDENLDGDRIPPELVDRSHRRERIREAARQLTERHRRLDDADDARDAAARARLARSQAGLPVVGCIPKGPHHLVEARAHLAREIRDHQAKLDRRAAIIASGRKPMGAPPVAMEQHSRILRARRVVAAAEQAARA